MSAVEYLPGFAPPMRVQPVLPASTKTPRYYQAAMAAEAVAQFRRGIRSTLAVMATGTGKTFSAAQVIKATQGRVLWVNERDRLASQVRRELEAILGEYVYLEQGQVRAPRTARVVVCTVQSMRQESRLATFERDHFSLIVFDEAHHSVAESYRAIMGHFSKANVLGLTAEPRRRDGIGMNVVYEGQCADYPMGKGVRDGYLVRPVIDYAAVRKWDLSGIKGSGELSDDALASTMDHEVIRGIVDETLAKNTEGRRAVHFFPRVDIAHIAAKAFNLIVPGCAAAVDGSMDPDQKEAILAAHRRGDFLYLCNDSIVTEGYDDPGIALIGDGRPTKSVGRYVQQTGRGTRPGISVDGFATAEERRAAIAASWKPNMRTLDFVGNAGRHADGLAGPVDAMAGRLDDEKTRQRAKDILREQGGGDVEEALEQARRLSEADRQAEAARIARVQGARWKWRTIDPFSAFGLEGLTDVAGDFAPPASLKMKRFLARRLGYQNVPDNITDADAKRLSRTIRVRDKKGLATFEQSRALSRHGISTVKMYASTADNLLKLVSEHRGWTPPQEKIAAVIAAGRTVGGEG